MQARVASARTGQHSCFDLCLDDAVAAERRGVPAEWAGHFSSTVARSVFTRVIHTSSFDPSADDEPVDDAALRPAWPLVRELSMRCNLRLRRHQPSTHRLQQFATSPKAAARHCSPPQPWLVPRRRGPRAVAPLSASRRRTRLRHTVFAHFVAGEDAARLRQCSSCASASAASHYAAEADPSSPPAARRQPAVARLRTVEEVRRQPRRLPRGGGRRHATTPEGFAAVG